MQMDDGQTCNDHVEDGGEQPLEGRPGVQNWRHSGPSSTRLGSVSERRQLYARDTRKGDDAPLVYIREGEADALRPDCRAGHLICPIPGCKDPRYTTKGGSKRDHFAHLSAQTDRRHSIEGRCHFFAKELIGQWLKCSYQGASVHVDDEPVDNGQRPDVLAKFPDGRTFAFEVQYSPITEAEWRRRHAGYKAEGIIDVWLFGHVPPHLRAANSDSDCDRFVLTDLIASLGRSGYRVRWIDPDGQTVASRAIESECRTIYPESGLPRIGISLDQLSACRLEGREFRTPTDDRAERLLREAQKRAEEEQAAREAAEKHRHEQELKREQLRESLQAAELARWSEVEKVLIETYGAVPPIIAEPTKAERALFGYHPCHWRAIVFACLMNGKVGRVFTYKEVLRLFVSHPSFNKEAGQKAITAFLFKLKRQGYVDFVNSGYWIAGEIRVLADLAA